MIQGPTQTQHSSDRREVATLGGGCFWCLEPIFDELRGVQRVEVGYAGGTIPNPTYQEVCAGTTGHAEVAQITFDPQEISFKQILGIFFTIHDPTTPNRQGADVGPQYRSVIFYHSPQQKMVAEQVIQEIEATKMWAAPIVTQVTPYAGFYKGEDYHQAYFKKNPDQGYCQVVIAPKVAKFRWQYHENLRSVPLRSA